MLYTATVKAEYISKIIYFIVHSISNLYAGKLAFAVLPHDQAQMVCLALVANHRVRLMHE
jgi:hypothetical protein